MTQIEWSEPFPCVYGRVHHDGLEIVGVVDGRERFKLQVLGNRSARLLEYGEFITLTAGEEIGVAHVDHLRCVAERILEVENDSD